MDSYVICPYFIRERKLSITCEDTVRSYPSYRDKRLTMDTYCYASWKQCPYASLMDRIYNMDIPYSMIKEQIMENKIEQQSKEINKLMSENGKLRKKIEKLEYEIKGRDDIAKSNHEMYRESLAKKDNLISAKDSNIRWLESLAAAFLVVAYGEDTREIRMSQDKVLKLMTEYKMTYSQDEETQAFIFQYEHVKPEKEQ